MRVGAGALLLALALCVPGCASSVMPGGGGEVASDVEELKRRVLELQKQAAVTEQELARLRRQVAALEAASAGRSPRRGAGEETVSRPSERGIARAPEPIVEVVELEDLEPERDDQRGNGEEDEPSERVDPAPPVASSPPEPADEPVSAAGQKIYDRGYTLYHQGRYLDAESTFRRFLQEHGSTELADNAQYWIGEARYARGDVPGALAAFRETVERYPEGNKVPDAMLKAGQALEALGDLEGARETYREVTRRFPESGAAGAARERLERLP